jgi:hypothetical protein
MPYEVHGVLEVAVVGDHNSQVVADPEGVDKCLLALACVRVARPTLHTRCEVLDADELAVIAEHTLAQCADIKRPLGRVL